MSFEGEKRDGSGPLKDSGERRQSIEGGAVRDRAVGKGRFDLLPPVALHLVALHFEQGAQKYKERNWELGMPLSWFLDSAGHHITKMLGGYTDEPHAQAAVWNLMCLLEGQERIRLGLWPAELDDLPKTYAGQDPGF